MKTKLLAFAVFFGGITAPVAGAEPHAGWHHNFVAASRDAEAAGLPLLLHFHAVWCGPCRQMERSVLNTPEVLTQLGTVVVGAKIDVDDQPEVAARFGVAAYPFDVVVAPDGEIVMRASGYADPGEYVEKLRTAAVRFSPGVRVAETSRPSDSGAAPGLNGYSPVSITRDRQWRKGRPELAREYEGVVYHFVDAGELELFRANPARYSPQFRGCDPILHVTENRDKTGDIHHAVFYRNRLYLLSTPENRRHFIESPDPYADVRTSAFVNGAARSRG